LVPGIRTGVELLDRVGASPGMKGYQQVCRLSVITCNHRHLMASLLQQLLPSQGGCAVPRF
jgi:hypothetical protein